ncbi:hypothetical protein D2E70_16370 [Mycobacteroides abscessus]|uniref:hypothetical protein n=1 Tax=Mycobacteroides abscessus TaxID=36809 RepID=UPI000E6901B4|nr:hypothetical protein [Mycobacteroides abscessus]RIS02779.1 hypothetical protein D2E45_12420 [Mycobacteroides abscessus]RIS67546.1 hypothetical protein D2E70_16370 [Mycobacteroides abscessus]
MKITPIPIPILSALAATAIITTACSAPPMIHDVGPAPSPSKTLGSEPKAMPAEVAASAIAAAKKFGADKVDTVAATGALTAGRPVLVGLPDGGNAACHAALLVPGDPKVWILNRSTTPTEGAALSREQLQYGCDAGMALPGQVPNASQPIYPLDTAARDAAAKAGAPFLYGKPDGTVAVCHTVVVLPSSATWILNREGGAPVEGAALDREGLAYGCDSGVERPTTPKGN